MLDLAKQSRRVKESDDPLYQDRHPSYNPSPLRALTENQSHYITAIQSSTLTFGIGPAGTGKTLIPVALAAEQIQIKQIDRLIITRPVMETGRTLGYLPGDSSEKYAPYVTPLLEALTWRLGRSQLEYALKCGRVVASPLEMMRGQSFHDCWVILDEAQNVTKEQMLMFLTRIGRNAKIIITGDPKQCDLRNGQVSGLMDAVERCSTIPEVRVVEFTFEDIVRSGIVKDILMAYNK
jgi:phosphate starvation-inducible protein PhoH and related proteins